MLTIMYIKEYFFKKHRTKHDSTAKLVPHCWTKLKWSGCRNEACCGAKCGLWQLRDVQLGEAMHFAIIALVVALIFGMSVRARMLVSSAVVFPRISSL